MQKTKITWIPVVAAIIRRGPQILLGQRPEEGSLAGAWELPGGKIEPREEPEEALRRELQEELGIEAEIGDLRYATSQTYGEVGLLLLFYEVQYWKGELKSVHHSKIRWVTHEEAKELEVPDANRRVLPLVFSHPREEKT
jgi:8-oxo-dGTP diphosphatase